MKKYRIKKIDALTLNGLRGLHFVPCCEHYNEILVLDNDAFTRGAFGQMPTLPKSCDTKLVCAVLNEMQHGKATSETVTKLKNYLQYTEKKDKNNEIKSYIKEAIKEVFFGLSLVMAGVAGFMLMLALIGLAPASASWISLLITPIVAVAVYGVLNALVGVLKFGFGIFSFCCQQSNRGQLLELENELHRFCFSPPPAYHEVMDNTLPTAPVLQTEPPTYQQAINNSANLSAHTIAPPIYIPARTSLEHSAHFFLHPYSVSGNTRVGSAPPVYRV